VIIADLEGHPSRLARIRRDNVVNSLRRHDWIYRWSEILGIVGLPHSCELAEREKRLEIMAQLVAASDEVRNDGMLHH
jgi:hypothetical protein